MVKKIVKKSPVKKREDKIMATKDTPPEPKEHHAIHNEHVKKHDFKKVSSPTSVGPRELSDEKAKQLEELHTKLAEILKEHDNAEGNIPLNHDYWNLKNQLRAI